MSTVDYSKYSIEELLDVRSRIAPDSPNFQALVAELDARKEKIDELAQQQEQDSFSIAENRVKIIGYFQLAAAVAILIIFMLSVFDGSASLLSTSISIVAIVLNAVAGYTAVREMHDKYWISVLNQLLQVPSFAIGSIKAAYSGLGGLYLYINWTSDTQFGFSASFSPGFSFLKYKVSSPEQFLGIDILALIFLGALLTVSQVKSTANKLIHPTPNSGAAD
ncbi:hypothetical protein ORJ00_15900 [Rheinheimera baltica]|uniref:hypothetical protein n=1 Tax=Rheinheimera baltica TaxID=67576 RepID=UPI00273E8BAD|nr:hypothetical protein [Rheinheimera baltica]MDP5144231.1 hypothetical protein [Rheinheimera baltica]